MANVGARVRAGEKAGRQRRRVESRPRTSAHAPVPVPANLRTQVPQGGRALDARMREKMQARFGEDFSHVLIHTGPEAQALAEAQDANAFALGDHLIFGDARFAPETPEGQRLIAHELAHVVQQRRGGAGVSAPAPELAEKQADRAAAAVVGGQGGQVQVQGAVAPAVMGDDKGRKKRQRFDDEDGDFDDADAVRDEDRATGKRRTQQRDQERQAAGKDFDQLAEEEAEKGIRKLEKRAAKPGANQRSQRKKEKDLDRFERYIDAINAPQDVKNTRKGNLDEAHRTPSKTSGKPQDEYVAGSIILPGQEVRGPNGRRIASHTRPDFSVLRRNKQGQLERVHFNLKSHKLDQMTPAQARAAAREILYQAVGNKYHLPTGEKLVISFARTPSKEVQDEIKKILFCQNTPIDEIKFGTTTHRESEHPKDNREPLDTDAKSRRRRLKEEAKAKAKAERDAKKAARAAEQARKKAERAAAKQARDQARADAKAKRDADRAAKKAERDAAEAANPGKARKPRKKATKDDKTDTKPDATAKGGADAKTTPKAPRKPRAKKDAPEPAQGKSGDAEVETQNKVETKKGTKRGAAKKAGAKPADAKVKPEPKVDDEPGVTYQKSAPRRRASKPKVTPAPGNQPADSHAQSGDASTQQAPAPVKPTATKPAPARQQPAPQQTAHQQPSPQQPTHQQPASHQQTPAQGDAGKPTANKPNNARRATPPKKASPPHSAPQKPPTSSTPNKSGMSSQGTKRGAPPRSRGTAFAASATSQKQSFYGDQVRISVQEKVGAHDKPFLVTTTVTVRGGATAGGSVGQDTSGSGHVGVSGSVSMSFTDPMTEAEKNAYINAITGGRGGPQPQLTVIELIARGQGEAAAKLIQKLRGSGDARGDFEHRQDGSEQELSVEGDVNAGLGGQRSVGKNGSFGAHVDLSSGKGIRRISTKRGEHEVITVIVSSRSARSLGGSAGYGVASMGYTDSRDQIETRSITFMLDPKAANYAALRAEILRAETIEALEGIAARNYGLATGRGRQTEQGQGGTTSAGVFGFGIELDQGGFYGEGEHTEDGQRVRTVTGGASLGGSFTLGGKRINPSSDTDSFSGWTDDNNVGGGETRSDKREVDWTRTLSRVFESDTPAATAVAASKQDKGFLQEKVDSSGKILLDDSYTRIANAAKDRDTWFRAWDFHGIARGAAEEWEQIRKEVLAAKGDRYKIEQAMAKWQKGDSHRSGDVQRLVGDTGIAFEFPDAIADQKPLYDALIAADPTGRAQELAADGKIDEAVAELNAIHQQLHNLLQKIQMHQHEIAEPDKFAEMQRRINQRKQQIRERINKLKPARKPAPPGQPAAPAVVAPPPDFIGPLTVDQQDARLAERREASERVRELVGECLSNRDHENKVFGEVVEEFDSWYVSRAKIFKLLVSLNPMYSRWDAAINDLRQQYPKQGDSADRANQFTPNRARWNELNNRALK